MKNLPIGYSNLNEIIKNNCVYVDKSKFVKQLIQYAGKYYFLSRPRRFGKSLFLDTIKQAFLGNKEPFIGLYLEHNWDWDIKYPIIHISFGSGVNQTTEQLDNKITELLHTNASSYQIQLQQSTISGKFKELITQLYTKHELGVVILIDEYDKPILDNIDNPDVAIQMRERLKDLYSVIKDCDQYIKLVFLTGVSKFSKVNLFSGLNNLNDITLDAKYADICGYTQTELEYTFHDRLIDVNLPKLKQWYNGYNFTGTNAQKVYNPADILKFFDNAKIYDNYWFETGNPSFLIKLLKMQRYFLPQIEKLVTSGQLLSNFDVNNISIEALLFQTGYLTISEIIPSQMGGGTPSYRLDYPNFEVRHALSTSLIEYFIENKAALAHSRQDLIDALINKRFDKLQNGLISLFASIPYNWYTNNDIANFEGFYATIVYTLLNSLGANAIAENAVSTGRIDLSIELPEHIVLLEFKLSHTADALDAIQQIETKQYANKFIASGKDIYLIGISFDTTAKNVNDFICKKLERLD
jgi:hypothetical protein